MRPPAHDRPHNWAGKDHLGRARRLQYQVNPPPLARSLVGCSSSWPVFPQDWGMRTRTERVRRVATALVVAAAVVAGAGATRPAASATTPSATSETGKTTAVALSWSRPSAVDPGKGEPGSLSCPSARFCMAVDGYGNALEWNGRGWSAPRPVDPEGAATSSVSCSSASFCIAVDLNDHFFAWDGRSWSAPRRVLPAATAPRPSDYTVSCTSRSFCMAGDGIAIWDGKMWSPGQAAAVGFINAASCATAHFCAAVGGGVMTTWDGQHWAKPMRVKALPENKEGFPDGAFQEIACTSADFCMAGTNMGYFLAWERGRWSSPVRAVYNPGPGGLACAGADFCVATGSLPTRVMASIWDGTGWSPSPVPAPALVVPISCASPSFCAAFDVLGQAVTWDGKRWSPPSLADGARGDVAGLSCAGPISCLMVDGGGNTLSWDGSTWSAPARSLALGSSFDALSCPTARFCMAFETAEYAAGDCGPAGRTGAGRRR